MMKLRVICVGLSRTGTSSLKAALSILLPGLTYHGMDFLNEVNSRESHEFWTAMRDGTASKQMIVDYFRLQSYHIWKSGILIILIMITGHGGALLCVTCPPSFTGRRFTRLFQRPR